ncbi:MAG: tRNA (N(6)-L-threonylcarbamoyladenosine(37)-C(2))-methylthiotransferase MtaB [Dialister micraerophilus]|uniref:tRNA (N(6)-L-threonylcarbamoyladenosine(37)-C(2))- methylthiotransferase MtaB n=1 Tax=Dialister micraerophilus TaxID=309120 RepID=UPI0023F2BE44|nr:tRNA (N(6)-L-threonylcarbamoyladenosine(37)-C(2))-methylthiotransferase MtaB [Dialister micraerophilus]MDK8253417.1 tRNA (N(6)-L-threonylcarbamoyladenosine(37)-C(2))-methylthiotransferase MtaB [Dialister micraerophilus]MDU5301422.1 tRNA (N(6)-L-threonylcarbamoyladenosine(37)-C(2))-methylthiotransferase MtaB [Dialister micraerophilus]
MINEREQCKNTKKVSFITLGCKVNQYDSDAMRTLFIHRGYKPVEHSEVADVYIINTCSVTSIGDRKSRQVIRKIRRNNPDAVIAATGCYAQVAPEELEKMGDVDVIVGHQNRNKIVDYIEEAEKSEKMVNAVKDIMSIREYENLTVDPEGEVKARAFVKVQEGCDNYCTFCIIPYARGRLKSRKQEDAVDEIKKLVEKGYREVVLTGIHLGNYGRDLKNGTSLSTLVSELLKIPNLLRIRLGSIESVELSDELINIIKNEKRVCHHLHLPLQSGSDAVLKSMNRHYRLRQYKDLIAMLREKIPNLALTTDLIVGFPGETEENFKETLNTLHELKFSAIHVFPFSKRTGTPAAMYPNQITNEEKKKRVHRVQELEKKISKEFRCEFLNKIVHVLAENKKEEYFEGFSDEYIRVTIKGENVKRGHLYSVIVEEVTDEGLIGRVIEEV